MHVSCCPCIFIVGYSPDTFGIFNNTPSLKPFPVIGQQKEPALVKIKDLDDSFIIDLKYATTDNFTGKKIYSQDICLIHRNTAQKLISAHKEFKQLGYRIKIYDAYRPYSAQRILYDAAENKSFLADPEKGSNHNRGAAVDITLVDEKGDELPMPSMFDEFSKKSRIDYYNTTRELINNRELLGRVMVKHGFKRIGNEWWHFDDTKAKQYPLLDIPFEDFMDPRPSGLLSELQSITYPTYLCTRCRVGRFTFC
ncbi:hypothetical protein N752_06135 [Desulforamulus aquiferis]|nr:D-alanyl-D-alanine dipeptidase [Desulforamulus aquiferis]RYD06105.1 hypothetical protein N752_06135 [Desulforamulus aquiferis]